MKCIWKTEIYEESMILTWDIYNHESILGYKFLVPEDAIMAGIK